MTSKEAARQHLKELKSKPLKQQLEYIVSYYWFPIVAVLAIMVFAVSYIAHVATLKPVALNVTCVNAADVEHEAELYIDEFAREVGIDLKENTVELSTNMVLLEGNATGSYSSAEVLITLVAAQTIDVMAADMDSMLQHFYQDIFADLTEVLSDEQTEKYQDSFLYIDLTVLEEVKAVTDLENIPHFPDPTKPEEMERPVPVAIRLPENAEFTKLYFPHCADEAVVGIIVNTKNISNALAFLAYIME